MFFECSKKCEKNTFFIAFPIVQQIFKTRRAIFTIVQPISTSVYCKNHQIYYSRDQSHFEKSITNVLFFKYPFIFVFFFVTITICRKHYFSTVIDILPAKNEILNNFYLANVNMFIGLTQLLMKNFSRTTAH